MILEGKGYLFVHLCEVLIQAGDQRLHAAEVRGERQSPTPKTVCCRPTAVAHVANLHLAGAVAVLEQRFIGDIDMSMHPIRRHRFRGSMAQGVHGAPKRVEQALSITCEDHGLTRDRSRAWMRHVGLQVGDNFLRVTRGVHAQIGLGDFPLWVDEKGMAFSELDDAQVA